MRPLALAAAALSIWLSVAEHAVPAQVLKQVLLNVNGDIITRRQLDERVRSARELGFGNTAAPHSVNGSRGLIP